MLTTSKYTRLAIVILSMGTVIGTTELASAGIRHPPASGPIGKVGPRPIGIGPIGIGPVRSRPPGIPGPIGIPAPGAQSQLH